MNVDEGVIWSQKLNSRVALDRQRIRKHDNGAKGLALERIVNFQLSGFMDVQHGWRVHGNNLIVMAQGRTTGDKNGKP